MDIHYNYDKDNNAYDFFTLLYFPSNIHNVSAGNTGLKRISLKT